MRPYGGDPSDATEGAGTCYGLRVPRATSHGIALHLARSA